MTWGHLLMHHKADRIQTKRLRYAVWPILSACLSVAEGPNAGACTVPPAPRHSPCPGFRHWGWAAGLRDTQISFWQLAGPRFSTIFGNPDAVPCPREEQDSLCGA